METPNKLSHAVKEYKITRSSESFAVMYEGSEKYMYGCIYNIISDQYEAQKLSKNVFMDAIIEISHSIEKLEDETRYLAWVGAIVTRKCFSYLFNMYGQMMIDEIDVMYEEVSEEESFIPESLLKDKQAQKVIRQMCNREMNLMQKICTTDYYCNGMEVEEIATHLGIPFAIVNENLSSARAKVKEIILKVRKERDANFCDTAEFMALAFENQMEWITIPQELSLEALEQTAREEVPDDSENQKKKSSIFPILIGSFIVILAIAAVVALVYLRAIGWEM